MFEYVDWEWVLRLPPAMQQSPKQRIPYKELRVLRKKIKRELKHISHRKSILERISRKEKKRHLKQDYIIQKAKEAALSKSMKWRDFCRKYNTSKYFHREELKKLRILYNQGDGSLCYNADLLLNSNIPETPKEDFSCVEQQAQENDFTLLYGLLKEWVRLLLKSEKTSLRSRGIVIEDLLFH
jgi:hypothetical protein